MFAVGVAFLAGLLSSPQLAKAQVLGEFDRIQLVVNTPFVDIEGSVGEEVIPDEQFAIRNIPNLDDGYALIEFPAGFEVEYNGEVFKKLWVCINGFVSFGRKDPYGDIIPPPYYPAKEPLDLFREGSSAPVNVLAPFWGDHHYRTADDVWDGWMQTRVSWTIEEYDNVTHKKVLTIQWKHLNINTHTVKSSIATFQLKIYESQDEFSKQCDIEFCYGPIGGNPGTPETDVITKNASIGIKGEKSDFLNGLLFGQDLLVASKSQELSNLWQPSTASDKRIRFVAFTRENIEEWWGDGDVDFSKAVGRKHYQMPQNRFVTTNDARLILRSIATGVPLDPVRRRSAYHGDVNHDGRYFFNANNNYVRTRIPARDKVYSQNLPTDVSSLSEIYFEATEHDGAIILSYIAARLPELPWVYDYWPNYGKVTVEAEKATNLTFGEIAQISENIYQVPVYINGYNKGPISAKFDINATVLDVQVMEVENSNLSVDFDKSRVVLMGAGEFDNTQPIMIVNFETANNNLKVRGIRFNDNQLSEENINLTSVEENNSNLSVNSYPNPFSKNTVLTVNLKNAGYYNVEVFDVLGNKVNNLHSGNLNASVHTFDWNGTNNAGTTVDAGVYIFKVTSENFVLTHKVVFNK